MFKITLFFTALVFVGEGLAGRIKGPEDELKALVDGVKQFVEEEKENAINAFETAVSKFTGTVRRETEGTSKDLEAMFDLALQDLSSMPLECAPPHLKHQVMILKSVSIRDFFHCPKLLTGLADVGAIIMNTVELVFELVRTGADFMTGFSKCSSWKPWVLIPCYYEHAKKIVVDIRTSVQMIKDYEKTVSALEHNITMIIHECRNSSAVQNSVTKLMGPAYMCAHQPMPEELYQIY